MMKLIAALVAFAFVAPTFAAEEKKEEKKAEKKEEKK
jgi:Ni/Co efflux regulator RcnB